MCQQAAFLFHIHAGIGASLCALTVVMVSWLPTCRPSAGANVSAAMLMPAKVKAAGGLLGVAATGGTVGIAAAALMLGVWGAYCIGEQK